MSILLDRAAFAEIDEENHKMIMFCLLTKKPKKKLLSAPFIRIIKNQSVMLRALQLLMDERRITNRPNGAKEVEMTIEELERKLNELETKVKGSVCRLADVEGKTDQLESRVSDLDGNES